MYLALVMVPHAAFFDAFLYHIKCHVLRIVPTYQALLDSKDKFTLPRTAFFVTRLCAALFIQRLYLALVMVPHAALYDAFLYHIKCHVLRTVHTYQALFDPEEKFPLPRTAFFIPRLCAALFIPRLWYHMPRSSTRSYTISLILYNWSNQYYPLTRTT